MISKLKIAAFAAALVLAGASQTAQAEGDVARGAKLGYTCLGCHGIEGYRNAYPSFRVPKLGGQKAAYLVAAIQGYRDGTRKHTTMNAQAQSLTDQDIEDVSAYFATLGTETVLAGGTQGASFDGAATCAACHGQNGISMSPMWPTLAGQHEDYLVHALKQYRDGGRKNPVMMPLAAPLTDTDIKLLAEYFSDLEGLETPKAD